jgi:hypothetical protein
MISSEFTHRCFFIYALHSCSEPSRFSASIPTNSQQQLLFNSSKEGLLRVTSSFLENDIPALNDLLLYCFSNGFCSLKILLLVYQHMRQHTKYNTNNKQQHPKCPHKILFSGEILLNTCMYKLKLKLLFQTKKATRRKIISKEGSRKEWQWWQF